MKIRFLSVIVLLFLFVSISCGDKPIDIPIPPKPEVPENPGGGNEEPTPTADTENWIYRKNKETGKEEKFFGIGTWHVMGFNPAQDPDPADGPNAQIFLQKTTHFNMVNIDPRYIKPYMSGKMLMINNFSPALHSYLDGIPGLPQGKDKDYHRTQFLKANSNNAQLISAMDNVVLTAKSSYRNFDRAYHSIDELALGGVARWFIPPAIGEKMYESVKKHEGNDAIFFVDLLGHGRGSTFFFEKNYLKDNATMPGNPPYELLSANAQQQKDIPLLGFFRAHDNSYVYNFSKDGGYGYLNLDIIKLKELWYENVKQIAEAYKDNGTVFGINAFRDFHAHPILAGVTVDALKAGLGDKPIWLYFDGNGGARPKSMSAKDYANGLKCQIYTSIVHGATGFFFWNDWSQKYEDGTPMYEVFDALLPIVKELNENQHIFYLPTIERKIANDLHVMIKKDATSGKKYIIATNTSKTSKLPLGVQGLQKSELAPMEVYISPML